MINHSEMIHKNEYKRVWPNSIFFFYTKAHVQLCVCTKYLCQLYIWLISNWMWVKPILQKLLPCWLLELFMVSINCRASPYNHCADLVLLIKCRSAFSPPAEQGEAPCATSFLVFGGSRHLRDWSCHPWNPQCFCAKINIARVNPWYVYSTYNAVRLNKYFTFE